MDLIVFKFCIIINIGAKWETIHISTMIMINCLFQQLQRYKRYNTLNWYSAFHQIVCWNNNGTSITWIRSTDKTPD